MDIFQTNPTIDLGGAQPHGPTPIGGEGMPETDVLKDTWDAINKALNNLMVAHAAGLVTCLTLVKDYKLESPGPLKGTGCFIVLFGSGLIAAILASFFWLLARTQFLTGRERVGLYLANLRAAYWPAFISLVIMFAAILFAVFRFRRL